MLALVEGHLEMTNVGPLGSAIMGGLQNSYFASTFEVVKPSSGKLAISKLMFRHL